jgi:hypothetical protein
MNMFYCYQIHDRANVYAVLLDGGRLFQQYLVDAYLCIEQNRLEYIRTNQNVFRTKVLSGVHDALSMGDTEGSSIERRIVLPSSFTAAQGISISIIRMRSLSFVFMVTRNTL